MATETAKYVCEAVGTFVLVFVIGCNIIMSNFVLGVLSIASTLMIMIYCFGTVSGGHFNPAVTFAVALVKPEFGIMNVIAYTLSQIIGAVGGAGLYLGLFHKSIPLAPSTTWGPAFAVELLYTFMLAFTVLNVAVSQKSAGKEYFGLAIGFVIVAGGYAVKSISGANFNPAVSFAMDLVAAHAHPYGWSWVYIVAQMLGGVLAAAVFRILRQDEFNHGEYPMMSEGTCKLISEFLGTFFLVLTVGFNITVGLPTTAALSIAASLMVMIYSLGSVSGAHFNPAVTMAVLLSGRNKISACEATKYILAQMIGGVLGSLTAAGITRKAALIGFEKGFSWMDCWLAESFFTTVLALTVLCVATTKHSSQHMFGLAIGFCIVSGGYACGGISGAHLNPAVSFGINAASSIMLHQPFLNWMLYTAFQLCGSVIAAGIFTITHTDEFAKARLFPE